MTTEYDESKRQTLRALLGGATGLAAMTVADSALARMACRKRRGPVIKRQNVSSSDQGLRVARRLSKQHGTAVDCCIEDEEGARFDP